MADPSPLPMRSTPWLVALLAVGLLSLGFVLGRPGEQRSMLSETEIAPSRIPGVPLAQLSDQESTREFLHSESAASLPAFGEGKFTTFIRRPEGPPTIALTEPDPQGRTGNIACSTCHSVRDPNYQTRAAADLDQFHQGMPIGHGQLTCYSCHNPGDTDTLRLADSSPVAFTDVMVLCSQCHGQQAKDYEHGLHGGMNGYWDLTRGSRTRNNCIDCHDPHVPAFPKMRPTFKPRDRFLDSPRDAASAHHGARPTQSESEGNGE